MFYTFIDLLVSKAFCEKAFNVMNVDYTDTQIRLSKNMLEIELRVLTNTAQTLTVFMKICKLQNNNNNR